ncbi:TetR/AcrR family transcriptional regulator [Cnuibacter physcomitrellae]|uniref:TetR/AcrR family transcriptional regulator n=1 Tax=Cnuibacter physcomitrellae TaxID=1619308 RepID=UPI0021757F13|nr:TetR/AcrR family transcriptional regulator [Cnuibacter physcomitrellae]MCS5498733.1 TetR/AcrR family transcriptional regulator [Cnuibacter physcomitrellae]
MSNRPSPRRPAGRPRASSKEMLEEAAAELFVENTYERTTIEQIAQRAGVSRNTFFNYFASKSDLLWARLDDGVDLLAERLAEASTHPIDPYEAVERAVAETLEGLARGPAPLVLTQYEVMGVDDDLRAGGLTRALRHAEVIERFLASRLGPEAPSARAVSLAVVGAAAAAVGEWATAGPDRTGPGSYAIAAVHPVLAGYRAADRPRPAGSAPHSSREGL